ncbi:MAG: family 43 glycosylhydrolase [Candidatus Saccharimonadaceae bacterium]
MMTRKLIIFSLFAIAIMVCKAQEFSNPTLQQWTVKDAEYNDPQNGNPILPGYYADPCIIEDNGTFYIYATSDLKSWNDISQLAAWSSTDLKNWKCQYLNWPTKDQCVSKTGRSDGVWAPSIVKAPNGKFYMYVTAGREIWVGVADHPLGPWKNALEDNQPFIRHKEHFYVESIDAECFIDDDGEAYLYWGSSDSGFNIEGRCLAVKLNKDMVSFDDVPRDVTPPYYFEAPYMVKRNGTYYFMYSFGHTWDKTYQVRYATGTTPFGPWTEGMVRPILVANEKEDRITSTGHHTILNFKGKDYIVYHRFNTMEDYDIAAKLRQVSMDEITYTADGGIDHVLTTHRGVKPIVGTAQRINLALNAKVNSSSNFSPETKATFAVDENNGTLWIGGKSEEEWIVVDLDRTKQFSTIEIYPEYPIYTYQYKMDISEDGKQWTNIKNEMNNTQNGSPFEIQKKTKARFVRITMPNREKGPRPGIWEIKIY